VGESDIVQTGRKILNGENVVGDEVHTPIPTFPQCVGEGII
jgi:hypothetical protein